MLSERIFYEITYNTLRLFFSHCIHTKRKSGSLKLKVVLDYRFQHTTRLLGVSNGHYTTLFFHRSVCLDPLFLTVTSAGVYVSTSVQTFVQQIRSPPRYFVVIPSPSHFVSSCPLVVSVVVVRSVEGLVDLELERPLETL